MTPANKKFAPWDEIPPWDDLRACAEELAKGIRGKDRDRWNPEHLQEMVHELLVHQIELQMMNLELRQTQVALEASRERYYDLYDSAPVGYLTLDAKGIIREANGTAAGLLGLPINHLLNRGLGRSVFREDTAIYYLHLRHLVQTGLAQTFELRMTRKEREVFWVLVEQRSADPDRAEKEVKPLYRTTLSDITEAKRYQMEKDLLRGQLAEARKMESLCVFARGMAQEVTKIFAAVQSLAEPHLQASAEGTALRTDLQAISQACAQGRAMTLALISFAKVELAEERVLDLNALVRDQVALLESGQFRKLGIELEVALENQLRPIRGDAAALAYALMNVCTNSLESMPQGGRLSLRTRNMHSGEVVLEVADTGVGMLSEIREKAIEPFFTTKRGRMASGMGLAVVYGAVRAHRGRLEIDSAPAAGTTVRMQFPAWSQELGNRPALVNPFS